MKRESIKDILECSGTIELPYKTKINEWYGQLKISKLSKGEYVIQPHWQKFSDIDDAVNWFMDIGLTSKNKGYIQNRLMDKGLINDNSDIETPSEEVKKLFREEGRLVNKEAKLLNIVVKPFPKEEDAVAHIESMIKNLTIDNLKDSLSEFEKEYMSLDPYISVSFVYDTETSGKKHEFSSGIDYESFSKKVYDRYTKKLGSSTFNSSVNTEYKHINLTIKLRRSDEYKRYELNF